MSKTSSKPAPGDSRSRRVVSRIPGIATSDGAGVKLRRSIGSRHDLRVDPFLLLDEFSSDDAADYIGGFPAHPHRGFETVTYMLDGHMLHEDHMGNRGDLRGGDVQWMTAGRGIIHSEMPQQLEGRMRGFQLWLNLPAADKMQPPAYRDIPGAEIPLLRREDGSSLRVVAGRLDIDGKTLAGPINGDRTLATDPLFLDVGLARDSAVVVPVDAGLAAFVYVFEGQAIVEGEELDCGTAGVLGAGGRLSLAAGPDGARLLLLAGRPLNEPIVQHGPFVMNTSDEIRQAMRDYGSGRLTD